MSDHRPVDPAKLQRQKRLEAQLRDNLKRRKAAANASAVSDVSDAPDADRAEPPSTPSGAEN